MALRTLIVACLTFAVLAHAIPSGSWTPWHGRGKGGSARRGYGWGHGKGAGGVDADNGIVDLGYAQYEGTKLSSGVNQFLGIRFAASPTGDNRFRAPQPPVHQEGIQKAQVFGDTCVGTGQQVGDGSAEDCLFLNVYAPANATSKSKLAVWVYIQGGGYLTDESPNFNGTNVVVRSGYNVVNVNFNYRVGALGFLASEKVRLGGALNAGMLDQRAALEWVQKHIHLFGGDPRHVVIHGASAGAGSIPFHMAAYGGRDDGLFAGAIAASPFVGTHREVSQMEFQYDRFVDQIGCGNSSDSLNCARSKDISVIQTANVLQAFPGAPGPTLWYFLPVIDGTFSQDYLYTQFLDGRFIKVPTIIGGDTDEGTLFVPTNTSSEADAQAFLKINYPLLSTQQLDNITALYPPNLTGPDDNLANAGVYVNAANLAYSDSTFACIGQTVSGAIVKYLSPAQSWSYRYNIQDPGFISQGLGVPHTSETPAVWGVGYAIGIGLTAAASLDTTNAGIVPIVMNYYLSFVQTLDPNTLRAADAPYWAPFEGSDGQQAPQRLKIQTNSTEMEQVSAVHEQRCRLWDSLYEVLQQ